MPVHAGQAMWKYTILTRPKYKLHQTRNDALLNVTLHFSGVNLHFSNVTLHFRVAMIMPSRFHRHKKRCESADCCERYILHTAFTPLSVVSYVVSLWFPNLGWFPCAHQKIYCTPICNLLRLASRIKLWSPQQAF